jgi:cathepsin A (carboxypeptidase C)
LSDIESYLNRPDIQEILGVDVAYKGCNMDVNLKFLMAGDWMRPYVTHVPDLLHAGIKILIYAGDADYICNYMGNRAWSLALEWEGADGFNAAPELDWVSQSTGKKAGIVRHFGGFAYLTVFEAGHMVPYDAPEHAWEMIEMWVHGHSKWAK